METDKNSFKKAACDTLCSCRTLDSLPLSERAYISSVNVNGTLRRRLLDLGFTEGSLVTPLYTSPLGDPTAYSVLGSTIALRQSSAALIDIKTKDAEADNI